MLLEVLDRKEPISWYDLSFSCKEHSVNFAVAFENSMSFLNLVSLVHIHADRSVSRTEEHYSSQITNQELGVLIMQRTVDYLETVQLLDQVFNSGTFIMDASSDITLINVRGMSAQFSLIRSLLLNLEMVIPGKNDMEALPVTETYKSYFLNELIPKIFQDIPPRDHIAVEPAPPLVIPNFFISYANKDTEFRDELQNHLSGLKRKKLINGWDGRAILPGEVWDDEIRQKLEQAEVVLFLVSSDFLASDYIHDVEIKKTIERYQQGLVRIIPVIVRPCDFESLSLNRYQALPEGARAISLWPNRDEAYVDIVKKIKRVIEQMSNQKNNQTV